MCPYIDSLFKIAYYLSREFLFEMEYGQYVISVPPGQRYIPDGGPVKDAGA